jgi:hypothetical protein
MQLISYYNHSDFDLHTKRVTLSESLKLIVERHSLGFNNVKTDVMVRKMNE